MLGISVVLLTSCFKEDEKVVPARPGDVTTKVIELLPDYSYQVYFKLSTNEETGRNLKDIWDISLTTTADDYTLFLNSSRFVKIAHTESDNFDVTYSTEGFVWQFDESTGNPLGNAIGKWWTDGPDGPVSLNEVLLVDKGIDADGLPAGFLKIQPQLNPLTKVVSIRIANLN